MDRPRHAKLIEEVRKTGCSIRLITDGDVAGVIYCTEPHKTGIDLYLGIGGAPEGVLAAAALRCVGGQMQGRLILDTEEKRARALTMGITDPNKKYGMEEMASGDIIVCATGVTDGGMLKGVKFGRERHRDRDHRLSLDHRHRPPHPRRAPRFRQVQAGLSEHRHCEER